MPSVKLACELRLRSSKTLGGPHRRFTMRSYAERGGQSAREPRAAKQRTRRYTFEPPCALRFFPKLDFSIGPAALLACFNTTSKPIQGMLHYLPNHTRCGRFILARSAKRGIHRRPLENCNEESNGSSAHGRSSYPPKDPQIQWQRKLAHYLAILR